MVAQTATPAATQTATPSAAQRAASAHTETELLLTGMTCASCANRIEKKLNKLDGVQAVVNYATERAHVRHEAEVTPDRLVEAVEQAGYGASLPVAAVDQSNTEASTDDERAEQQLAELRRTVLLVALLSVPVIAMGMVPALQFRNWQWLSLVLTAPVVVWGGARFHRAAWRNLRQATATMDTLVSVGTLAALAWSVVALFFGTAGTPGMKHEFEFGVSRGHGMSAIYLEAAAGVTMFILLGRYFEAKAKRSAGAALRALLDLGAKQVAVLRDGVEHTIDASALAVGDLFVVRPGEKVATDGRVVEGHSAVDESLITGESVPVEVGPDSSVVGACVNTSGRLVVRATRVGADTQLAQMARLVSDAQSGKAATQRLADAISGVFVPVVVVLAIATLGFWWGSGAGWTAAFTAAVAVLIIACPCALGLATPVALLVGTGRGAQMGIVIKGPEALEQTRRVDTVVLDKTGTITTGQMSVVEVIAEPDTDREQVLRLAGAVEQGSEHPIGRAIAAAAAELGQVPASGDFTSQQGGGVIGSVDGRRVVVGREGFVVEQGQVITEELRQAQSRARASGATVVVVAWDGAARGLVVVADTPKPTSAQAITELRRLGLRPMLLTGDHETSARTVAAQVGVAEHDVIAEVRPADKVAVVMRLQDEGATVAMVGDGVNDAAALAQADLGLAMGTGADVAIEASDLTLVRGDLQVAVDAIRLSRSTLSTIKQNLFWAFAYNVAAIPLAMAGLLNPMIAGAAMALSSLFVVGNSLRLRRFR